MHARLFSCENQMARRLKDLRTKRIENNTNQIAKIEMDKHYIQMSTGPTTTQWTKVKYLPTTAILQGSSAQSKPGRENSSRLSNKPRSCVCRAARAYGFPGFVRGQAPKTDRGRQKVDPTVYAAKPLHETRCNRFRAVCLWRRSRGAAYLADEGDGKGRAMLGRVRRKGMGRGGLCALNLEFNERALCPRSQE